MHHIRTGARCCKCTVAMTGLACKGAFYPPFVIIWSNTSLFRCMHHAQFDTLNLEPVFRSLLGSGKKL